MPNSKTMNLFSLFSGRCPNLHDGVMNFVSANINHCTCSRIFLLVLKIFWSFIVKSCREKNLNYFICLRRFLLTYIDYCYRLLRYQWCKLIYVFFVPLFIFNIEVYFLFKFKDTAFISSNSKL